MYCFIICWKSELTFFKNLFMITESRFLMHIEWYVKNSVKFCLNTQRCIPICAYINIFIVITESFAKIHEDKFTNIVMLNLYIFFSASPIHITAEG